MEFKWLNKSLIEQKEDRIEIMAPAQTDFFCGSIDECQEGILPESPLDTRRCCRRRNRSGPVP